jgi:hypothetical protein
MEKIVGLYSPKIIRLIKWRKMRWVEHIARMEDIRNAYKVSAENPQGKILIGRILFR